MSGAREVARKVAETARVSGPWWTASLVLDRIVPGGVLRLWPERRVAADALRAQLADVFAAWGLAPEAAAVTVENLLWADLRGIDSHGSSLVRGYDRSLRAGALAPAAEIMVVRDEETTALLDGGGGLGHLPATRAMALAIEKGRAKGLGAVAVRNSGHYGAAGIYAAQAAAAGLLGFATTNTREPAVVPTFARAAMLGTNPIALAAPAARNPPFLLDMATSTASLGAMLAAWRRGHGVPAGWALDASGEPETNGRRASEGRRLTPLGSSREMGSHKGYGLALAMEILASVLSGARRADDPRGRGRGSGVGHFFLALDPARFRAAGEFEADLDVLLDSLRAAPPARKGEAVLVAGDPERAAFEERSRRGIPLPRSVLEDLRAVARAAGVGFRLG